MYSICVVYYITLVFNTYIKIRFLQIKVFLKKRWLFCLNYYTIDRYFFKLIDRRYYLRDFDLR